MSDATNGGWFGVDRRSIMKGIGLAGLAAALGGASQGNVAAQSSGSSGRGPYRNSRFLVEIDGIAVASFNRIELPEAVIPEVEYRDGNDPPTARKLTAGGNNEYGSLLLEKGVTEDSIVLYEWFKQAQEGKMEEARRAIAVVLLNQQGEPGARWEFRQAWPARYDAPNLNAQSNEVAVESFEILHEGMERVS